MNTDRPLMEDVKPGGEEGAGNPAAREKSVLLDMDDDVEEGAAEDVIDTGRPLQVDGIQGKGDDEPKQGIEMQPARTAAESHEKETGNSRKDKRKKAFYQT